MVYQNREPEKWVGGINGGNGWVMDGEWMGNGWGMDGEWVGGE